jgi:hypothetical protein
MDRTTFIVAMSIIGFMVLAASLPNSMYKANTKVVIASAIVFLILSSVALFLIYRYL